MITFDPRERLWASEAAAYMGLSRSTLAKWRMRGEGPPYHKCGRRLIYYYKSEIDAWLKSCDGCPVELNDLLPPVLARFKALCGRAADAAQSWGK